MDNPKTRYIVGFLILALAVAGMGAAFNLFSSGKDKIHIEANTNIIFTQGQELTGIQSDELRKIVESSTKGNKEFIKDVLKLIKPAKSDLDASITLDKNPDMALTNKAIAQTPTHILDEDEEGSLDLNDLEIYIRATDKDKAGSDKGE